MCKLMVRRESRFSLKVRFFVCRLFEKVRGVYRLALSRMMHGAESRISMYLHEDTAHQEGKQA